MVYFVKQETAYEMRSRDWSSDVCSSDLECLQNPAASFGRPLDGIDPRAVALATLREKAGPFVAFLEDGAGGAQEASRTGLEAGRYGPGRGAVRRNWGGCASDPSTAGSSPPSTGTWTTDGGRLSGPLPCGRARPTKKTPTA